jgi:chromosomal replication initiation ATPase DnaA
MKVVQGEFDVSPQELRSRRNASDARLLTMKLLHEEAAMSQRQVAVELGLQDGSGVSRRLSELAARMNRERKLKRFYDRLRGKLFR